ncbi:hypothetical protein JOC75_000907 [Metabacillus crassostreae]|nr:hypothetical protein [Metabacillus crassostreae]
MIIIYKAENIGVDKMSKAKGKGGTGRGTGKKGWTRWQTGANKAKSAKPYKSKGVKHGDANKTSDKID